MKSILGLLSLMTLGAAAPATTIAGYWQGTAMRGGEAVPIALHVEPDAHGLGANYDLPALGLEGMPLPRFTMDPASGAINAGRTFSGRFDGQAISGELFPALLHGAPVTVTLRKAAEPPALKSRERAVEFISRGKVLKGWLVSPLKPGRYPAMVSLHGSGPSTRWLALGRARRFAEAGYAMLIFDKPGSGESQGDWTMTSLDEMAEDAIAASEWLRGQPEADPGKVGLWAHSQAGWVVSRVAAMPNHVAFAIVLAGGGSTSREVEDYGYLGRLRQAKASAPATRTAMAWVSDYYDYVRTGAGYEALSARLKDGADEEWAKALGIGTVYPTPEQQPKWQWVATYDPLADIRRIGFPVLLMFADQDDNTPSAQSLARWREGLAGNRSVEWTMVADADHHFLTPAHTDGWPRLAPGFYDTQIDWLRRHVR
jgi:dipeptidyl aminopeptidase/acylaminoacyl peptidase